LLAIAAPAAYMILTWTDEPAAVADQSFEFEGSPPGVADEPKKQIAPPKSFVADRVQPSAPSSVEPAGFEREVAAPKASPVDRYATPAAGEAQDRYSTGERYAVPAPSASPVTKAGGEPAEFAPSERVTRLEADAPADNRIAAFESPEPAASAPAQDTPFVETQGDTVVSSLTGAPVYGDDDLAQAMEGAEPAARGFVAGDLADPSQASAMGQHYARLCYLAQVLTFYEPAGDSTTNLSLEAADILKRSLRTQAARDNATQVAAPWIAWTGKPHGGVMFAGTPTVATRAGSVYEYRFPVGDEEVVVVSQKPFDVDRFVAVNSRAVGVIGVMVESPRERIAGYTGDAERVVWARKTLTLREPSL
jgi:hypothetical protein